MNKRIWKSLLLLAAWVCLSGLPDAAWALPTLAWDWNDGTLQGWTPELPFAGALVVGPAFGNPGGSMFATDTVPMGGGLLARAPSVLAGDLSIYPGIAWDEFIPNHGSSTVVSTSVLIRGTDGTWYGTDSTLGTLGTWNSKLASFSDPSAWVLASVGTTLFSDVIANVDAVFISMETSLIAGGAIEAWVDNVVVNRDTPVTPVPEPATSILLVSGLLVFASSKRRWSRR
ncbi:PEP-CTERM sorting domain-containing protein [Geobacter sp.]|uniref:PEP-CTERM sorting domain-containing protein n=1 Tax=Geobacter sp. TaxID=46610 RepID=UPI0027B9634D|nr:PEP-CTERM sorting domain-containing protein [Geobacter sp.]